ncbi:MAG: hypothetical protein K6E59_04685 [Bacilli bacterium]|nr:hypothetical protein [Bacilli bacterium]
MADILNSEVTPIILSICTALAALGLATGVAPANDFATANDWNVSTSAYSAHFSSELYSEEVDCYFGSPLFETTEERQAEPTRDGPYLADKYIEIGNSSAIIGTNTLTIGKSALMGFGTSLEYQAVYEITLPDDGDYLYITSAYLNVIKNSGSLSQITAYKASGITYSNLTGTSSYTSTYIGGSLISGNMYTIDLTNTVKAAYQNGESSIIVVLAGAQNNKTNTVHAAENSTYGPSFIVSHRSRYGAATSYVSLPASATVNCYGYALGYTSNAYIDSINQFGYQGYWSINHPDEMAASIANDISSHVNSVRVLNSYDDYIGASERRIAFRYVYNTNTYAFSDFHFVQECSDGTWCGKAWLADSVNYGAGVFPNNASMWPGYNSITFYFAIVE